jgi:cholesterol oxidase
MVQRLSLAPEAIKPSYSVIVIGSGYGGGVAASRLARAKQTVCVLERGRELQPGEYPASDLEAYANTQVDTALSGPENPTALYDFRINEDMNVLIGCGLGGTSLINANVGLEPDPRVFDSPRWPREIRPDSGEWRDAVARAQRMLGAQPLPTRIPDLPKLKALEMVANRLQASVERPPLYVTFDDTVNEAWVEQKACIQCGDCVTGCNHWAKNTTLMNYLPDACNHGAEIFCEAQVRWVERSDDGRWTVRYQLLGAGRGLWQSEPLAVAGDVVVLAAGTLGSTEILLRSQEHGLSLSSQLGQMFSANGDILAFAYNTDTDCNSVGFGSHVPVANGKGTMLAPVGPCITGVIRINDADDLQKQFIIEEGSLPGPLACQFPGALALAAHVCGVRSKSGFMDLLKEKQREADSMIRGARHGAVENSLVYLGMSFDDAAGEMRLTDDRLRIDWPGVGAQRDASRVNSELQRGSEGLGGLFVQDPLWSKLLEHKLISVHPLGGCAMGATVTDGVVDHRGEVFDSSRKSASGKHDGLFVMDGSIVPTALGLNPSLTIAALAERSSALMAAERKWTIDPSPSPKPIAPVASTVGIEFTEVMRGFISDSVTNAQLPDEFEAAAAAGKVAGASIEFEMTIRADDVAAMIADPQHSAPMAGTVNAPTLDSGPLAVTDGSFQCFAVDPTTPDTRNLVYGMTMRAENGSVYYLYGKKIISISSIIRLWPQTTTLYVTVHDGPKPDAPVKAQGVMRVEPGDFIKQLSTMHATGASNFVEGLKARVAFGTFFAKQLFETYGGVFARLEEARKTAVDPDAPPRVRRALRVPEPPEVYPFVTDDNVELLLTRYRGGTKGPVLVSHGLGVSSLIFSIDTIGVNLLEYLVGHEYDVWLLDYRASIVLPAASTQFSGDEIARHDYPAAVRQVQQVTGVKDIQLFAHCFGSTTFFMAMLAGLQGVRSAVCSQIGCHVLAASLTRFKAGVHLDAVVTALGVKTMTAYASRSENWRSQLFDYVLTLNPVPGAEYCDSEVCHRITFLYSLLYEHAQLDDVTHQTLHEMFGVANVGALDHLATMVRHQRIVDAQGDDVYMPNVKNLAIPISIIHGAQNHCFLPESTEQTLEWMSAANGRDLYDRKLIPGYGHIDCIFGRDAARDVFPYVVQRLDLTAG